LAPACLLHPGRVTFGPAHGTDAAVMLEPQTWHGLILERGWKP